MDVPAPGVGAECGPCPLGFTGDSQKCYGQHFHIPTAELQSRIPILIAWLSRL